MTKKFEPVRGIPPVSAWQIVAELAEKYHAPTGTALNSETGEFVYPDMADFQEKGSVG